MSDADIIAKLAKPGAGLPFVEGMIVRWWVGPVLSKKNTWDENKLRFEKTTQSLLKLIEGLDEAQLATRVLVPPQQGLEDSSRYWSAAMLFEHLVIVGEKVKGGILALSKGIVPVAKADTASVKPTSQPTAAEAIAGYRKFSSTVMDDLDKGVKDKDSKATFPHPWMGPLNCRQWHWLLAAHQGIHLRQLREIVKGLSAPK
ncbi:MAG: DinB family protein [Alphaproteobacteria bacterium]